MVSEKSNNAFAKAFLNAQSQFKNIEKNKQGHNYKYADLPAIIEHIKPILKENNLYYTQSFKTLDDNHFIETRLSHVESDYTLIDCTLVIPENGRNKMQSLGSAITYARRYGLQNVLGIVGDEDTDGVVAQPQRQQHAQQKNDNKQIDYKEAFVKHGKFLAGSDHNKELRWNYIKNKTNYDLNVKSNEYWMEKYSLVKKIDKKEVENALNS